MIVTISGESGSGKTTVGKLLAEKLNYQFFSGGYFFRKKAEEYGMSLLDFSGYAEKHPEIDLDQDKMILDFMKNHDNIVMESRLSGVLAYREAIAVKIYLDTSFCVRSRRLMERDAGTDEKHILARSRSEILRYMEFYGLDYRVFSYYDYIVDTDDFTPETIVEWLMNYISNTQVKNKD
ncbi:(d)CMP kinase [Ferroplasma sp.]|uniref:(d)CMP kinase n=1 Tax=Ferroplasma sp. TaxID=2591003 RepID=UPI00260E5C51|nr:AAA family ATPase [Ferroplasma sp.]MCL4452881.1 AAA family ATPase [Candidatus Thermoplasmatota archaeon]